MNIGSVAQAGGAVRHIPLSPLAPAVADATLDQTDDLAAKHLESHSLGGFISSGRLAWRTLGSTIEIFDPLTCRRHAAWSFGTILHNHMAKVTCVCGIGVGTATHVAVGIDLGCERKPRGMVGILSLRRSRITRAFHFQHKVTTLCMITGGESIVDPSTLAKEIQSCQGLLAVATAHAYVFLLDIALDLGADEVTSDEVSPASYFKIMVPDPNAEVNRRCAVDKRLHPMLFLNVNKMRLESDFHLLGPDNNVLYECPSQDVIISSMVYIPQLASLIIGYNFGSFQIINLSLIIIDCTSLYEENLPPVRSVTYQEPENDPRSFVYLWICRSFDIESNDGEEQIDAASVSSTCSLYALNYEKKVWIEGHGLWYQGLLSISPRFELDLRGLSNLETSSCVLFSSVTVVGATPSNVASPLSDSAVALSTSDDESGPVPELSLCMFCWKTVCLSQGKMQSQYYLSIFDINRWYQAQMPSRLSLDDDSLCPYMSFHFLDKVPKSLNERLLSAIPRLGSWSRYASKSVCENDFFPSSLSYELDLLTSDSLVTYHCKSVQERALSALIQKGPRAIVSPHVSHNACVFAGVISQDLIHNDAGSAVVMERENLLNVALEHHLLPFLLECITEFSEGHFAHMGCSLEVLLDWAWDKVYSLKSSYSTLCAPLFSSIPGSLSHENLMVLHQDLTFLTHLSAVVAAIRDNAMDVTAYSKTSIDGRVQVVQILQMHLQATLWFFHCGLLPQFICNEPLEENFVPFPAQVLQKAYDQRYLEIKKLSRSLSSSDLLLIDCIIGDASDDLGEIWEKRKSDSCGGVGGVYPPPSLHALLSMYMLPALLLSTKHRIVQYLFLDLASLLSEDYSLVVEELVKFPSSFSLSPSLIKITQAFWLVDHGFFQEGLDVLLHPLVTPDDVTASQHRRIIRAFLYQGEEKLALTYSQLRQPPQMELEDIRLHLTVLLANGLVREAFHFQRTRCVRLNAKDLLNHLFRGCEQMGSLDSIVQLPLSVAEEEAFVAYLHSSKFVRAQDILLSYFVQQSRYSEIDDLGDGGVSPRSAIVHGFLSHLPNMQHKKTAPKASFTAYKQPQPFSARIRQSVGCPTTPYSKATGSRMEALQTDLKRTSLLLPQTPFRSKVQRRQAVGVWKKEIGLINHSIVTKDDACRENSRIVFPLILGEESKRDSIQTTTTPFNESRNSRVSESQREDYLIKSITKVMQDVLQKTTMSANVTPSQSTRLVESSSDVLSLLKTPVHVSSNNTSFLDADHFVETPQSILKVRKILQRSLSPSEMSDSFGISFPSYRPLRKQATLNDTPEALNASENDILTPKQLRFHFPEMAAASPAQEEEVDVVHIQDGRRKQPVVQTLLSQQSPAIPSPRKPLAGFVEKNAEELQSDDDLPQSDSLSTTPEFLDDFPSQFQKTTTTTTTMEVESTAPTAQENEKLNNISWSETSGLSMDESFHSIVDEHEHEHEQQLVDALEVAEHVATGKLNLPDQPSIEKSLAIDKTLREIVELAKSKILGRTQTFDTMADAEVEDSSTDVDREETEEAEGPRSPVYRLDSDSDSSHDSSTTASCIDDKFTPVTTHVSNELVVNEHLIRSDDDDDKPVFNSEKENLSQISSSSECPLKKDDTVLTNDDLVTPCDERESESTALNEPIETFVIEPEQQEPRNSSFDTISNEQNVVSGVEGKSDTSLSERDIGKDVKDTQLSECVKDTSLPEKDVGKDVKDTQFSACDKDTSLPERDVGTDVGDSNLSECVKDTSPSERDVGKDVRDSVDYEEIAPILDEEVVKDSPSVLSPPLPLILITNDENEMGAVNIDAHLNVGSDEINVPEKIVSSSGEKSDISLDNNAMEPHPSEKRIPTENNNSAVSGIYESCFNDCLNRNKVEESPVTDHSSLPSIIAADRTNRRRIPSGTPIKETPLTPLRRSRRLSGVADDGLVSLESPVRRRRSSGTATPTQRKRRLESDSDIEDTIVSTTHPIAISHSEEENHVSCQRLKLDTEPQHPISRLLEDEVFHTPVKRDDLPSSRPGTPLTPGGRKKNKLTPETPVRRSARLCSSPATLGTILEEKSKIIPENQISADENTPKSLRKSPMRSRKSISKTPFVDSTLETIKEGFEVGNFSLTEKDEPTSSIGSVVQIRTTRRRSLSAIESAQSPAAVVDVPAVKETPSRRRRSSASSARQISDTSSSGVQTPKDVPEDSLAENYSLLTPLDKDIGKSTLKKKSNVTASEVATLKKMKTATLRLSKIKDHDTSLEVGCRRPRKSKLHCLTPPDVVLINEETRNRLRSHEPQQVLSFGLDLEDSAFIPPNSSQDQSSIASNSSDAAEDIRYDYIKLTPGRYNVGKRSLSGSRVKRSYNRRPFKSLSKITDFVGISDEEEEEIGGKRTCKGADDAEYVFSKPVVEGAPSEAEKVSVDNEALEGHFVFSPPCNEKAPPKRNKARSKRKPSGRKKR